MRALLVVLLAGVLAHAEPRRFRVVSYNILVGFANYRVGEPYHRGNTRKENVFRWLKKQKPDVVSLQELTGYTPARLKKEAAAWGHEHAVLLKERGFPTGLTSKHPITIVERRLEGLHHGLMVCRTAGIDFVVAHLWPFKGPERRLREVKHVLELAKKSKGPVIALGDFNAVSPLDLERFSEKALERYRKWKWETVGGKPNVAAIQAVMDAGFVDVYAKHRKGEEKMDLPRIDFVFASPGLAKRSLAARWIADQETLRNSDHPPVVADFDWSPPAAAAAGRKREAGRR